MTPTSSSFLSCGFTEYVCHKNAPLYCPLYNHVVSLPGPPLPRSPPPPPPGSSPNSAFFHMLCTTVWNKLETRPIWDNGWREAQYARTRPIWDKGWGGPQYARTRPIWDNGWGEAQYVRTRPIWDNGWGEAQYVRTRPIWDKGWREAQYARTWDKSRGQAWEEYITAGAGVQNPGGAWRSLVTHTE